MKIKYLLGFILTFAIVSSCVSSHKAEKKVTSMRHARAFDRIEVNDVCNVVFTQADTFGIKVVGAESLVKKVRTTIEGSTLKISTTAHINLMSDWKLSKSSPVVYVSSPDLIKVDMNGVGEFAVNKPLDTDTLRVCVKGVGDVSFKDVICDKFEGTLLGTGDLEVKNLTSQYASIHLRGTGDIDVHFSQCKWVESWLEGVGDITLTGTVDRLKKKVHGTGDIDVKQLKVIRQ